MPHSHHSHSGQFCKHATGLLEDVVLEAIRQGFEVYGLTEHVPRYRTEDFYPEEVIQRYLILLVLANYSMSQGRVDV
jgi:HisJ family histidinol phosphate phosphatase